MQKHTIISISRQYGSGGKEVAELVAKKMKVRCYDRQIVYLAAEQMGESDLDIDSILEDVYKTPESNLGSMGAYGFEAVPFYNRMFREQAKTIRRIADKESAVFLGRCADAVLKDYENCYSFFIYADEEYRKHRAAEFYNNQSVKEMDKENKTREKYYNYYTGQKWGEPKNYDMLLDTSRLSLEDAAELIINYTKLRQKEI